MKKKKKKNGARTGGGFPSARRVGGKSLNPPAVLRLRVEVDRPPYGRRTPAHNSSGRIRKLFYRDRPNRTIKRDSFRVRPCRGENHAINRAQRVPT